MKDIQHTTLQLLKGRSRTYELLWRGAAHHKAQRVEGRGEVGCDTNEVQQLVQQTSACSAQTSCKERKGQRFGSYI